VAAELKAKVSLNTTAFDRGLRSLRRSARNFGRNFGAPLAEASRRLMRFAVIAGGVAVFGITRLIKSTADFGDQLDKLSKKTGISTNVLGQLAYAAEIGGGSIESIEKATKRMASAIQDANDGLAESQRAFDALGLSWEDMRGKTPEDQLLSFLRALEKVEDPTKRAALAQDVFGRAGTSLLPMLADLEKSMARAKELGIDLSPEQAKAAADFKDSLTDLKGAFRGLAVSGIDFAPMIRGIRMASDALIKFRESGRFKALQERIRAFTASVVTNSMRIVNAWRNLQDTTRTWVGNMAKLFGALLVAWRLGLVAPMLSLTSTLVVGMARGLVAIVSNFGGFAAAIAMKAKAVAASMITLTTVVAGALAAMGLIVVGFSLGETLENQMDLSTLVVKVGIWLDTLIKTVQAAWAFLGNQTLDLFDPEARKRNADVARATLDEIEANAKESLARLKDQTDAEGPKPPFGEDFRNRLEENVGKIDGVVSPVLDKLGKKWKQAKDAIADIKETFEGTPIPDLPTFDALPENVNRAADGMERFNKEARGVPTRGMIVAVRDAADAANKARKSPFERNQARWERRQNIEAIEQAGVMARQPLAAGNIGGGLGSMAKDMAKLVLLGSQRNMILQRIEQRPASDSSWL
jgi:hypothetical protein